MAYRPRPLIPDLARQGLTLLAIIAAIVINGLSNVFPLAGLNVADISNQILSGVVITPASYAFAIWGVIYLGLISFGIYQARPQQRSQPALRRIDYGIIAASACQILWIGAFQLQWFWLSVLLMLGILGSLMVAYRVAQSMPRSRPVRWQVKVPLSLYLGWISVATLVNVAGALFHNGWNGWWIPPSLWTLVMLAVSSGIAAWLGMQFQDGVFAGVVIWALVAIAVRNASDQILVWGCSLLGGLLILTILVVRFRRSS